MGMPKIEFRLQMFRGDWDQVWSQLRLLWAMEGLCRINGTHIRQFDEFKKRGMVENTYPPVYRAGLHYETEKGTEIWPDIPSLYAGTMGEGVYPGPWGDCEDFSCVRVAEYRELPWHYEKSLRTNDGKLRLVQADPRFPQGDWESAIAAELPSAATTVKDPTDPANWPGWKKVAGGIAAKPFAKWRRGPHGNYHYHALVLMPDGRLEDPSLVLGMGSERQFHENGMAEKMKDPSFPVRLQYAKPPEVMVVDPEKPSGFSGGKAVALDSRIKKMVEDGMAPEDIAMTLGDVEIGAYLGNTIPLGEGEFDVDAVIGWNRAEGRFEPKSDTHELRRLTGYVNHD